MSSEYIPRLRRELVAAAARERRTLPQARPLALAAVAVAAAVLALVVIRPEIRTSGPAADQVTFHLTGGEQTAAVIHQRLTAAHVQGVDVNVNGGEVGVSAPPELRGTVDQMLVPGRFAVYDWESSVVGRPAVGEDVEAAALPLADAVRRASRQPAQAAEPSRYWLLDGDRVLAGPSPARDFGRPGRVVQVPGGVTVLRAERQADRGYVLLDHPALTNRDLADTRAGHDPQFDQPVVLLGFTAKGEDAFSRLTRSVAHRGAARQAMQHLALVVDDRIMSVPFIDYRVAPDGIDGRQGGQISGDFTTRDAQILAAVLSSGPLR